jgi:hypothetical protein
VPPPLQIKVDQAGKPPGVPGQAREDLALGTAVQLTSVGGPFEAYLWTIEFKPVDVVAGVRSAAALTSATLNATLLQPVDKPGTFRVGLAVDAGFGLGAREQDVAFITFYAGPTLNPNAAGYPRRVPATGETTEHNVPDAIDPAGNGDGWAREEARWKAAQGAGTVAGSASSLSGVPPYVIDWGVYGAYADLTLLVNTTLGPPLNVLPGGRYAVTVRQGAGGPYTFAWDPAFHFGLTFTGAVTNVAGAVDVFEFVGSGGGVLYCVGQSNGVQ